VTTGSGRSNAGGSDRGYSAGDVIWFEPAEKHWQWRYANHGMTHIAIQNSSTVRTVDWMEQVSDDNTRSDRPGFSARRAQALSNAETLT